MFNITDSSIIRRVEFMEARAVAYTIEHCASKLKLTLTTMVARDVWAIILDAKTLMAHEVMANMNRSVTAWSSCEDTRIYTMCAKKINDMLHTSVPVPESVVYSIIVQASRTLKDYFAITSQSNFDSSSYYTREIMRHSSTLAAESACENLNARLSTSPGGADVGELRRVVDAAVGDWIQHWKVPRHSYWSIWQFQRIIFSRLRTLIAPIVYAPSSAAMYTTSSIDDGNHHYTNAGDDDNAESSSSSSSSHPSFAPLVDDVVFSPFKHHVGNDNSPMLAIAEEDNGVPDLIPLYMPQGIPIVYDGDDMDMCEPAVVHTHSGGPVVYVQPGKRGNNEYHHNYPADEFVSTATSRCGGEAFTINGIDVMQYATETGALVDAVVEAMIWEYSRFAQSSLGSFDEVIALMTDRFVYMSAANAQEVGCITWQLMNADRTNLSRLSFWITARVEAMIAARAASPFITDASLVVIVGDAVTLRINMLAYIANRSFSWYYDMEPKPIVYTTDVAEESASSPAAIGLRYVNGKYATILLTRQMSQREVIESRVERINPY